MRPPRLTSRQKKHTWDFLPLRLVLRELPILCLVNKKLLIHALNGGKKTSTTGHKFNIYLFSTGADDPKHMYHIIEQTLSRIFSFQKHRSPRTSCSQPSYNKCLIASKGVEYAKVLSAIFSCEIRLLTFIPSKLFLTDSLIGQNLNY